MQNHIENLDPALIRPGRCDVRLEVKPASKMQLENMFLRFHPNCADLAAAFAKKLPPETISMAKLQGYFLHVRCAQSRISMHSECYDSYFTW
jgi:chaperone BCS1